MALASKRSIRNDYKNAGGDNLYPAMKSVQMGSSGNPQIKKMSGARPSVESHRFLGGLVGNKEIAAMTLLAVSLYLINGEHAHTVCTVLTSIPPAVFSYKVLISRITSKEGYHSILFYWTLYGVLALIDQFIGTTQGYNLIKSGVLGTVFLNAVRSNPSAIPRSWQYVDQVTAGMLTSIFTSYDSHGFEKKTNSSGFAPVSPTITAFSVESECILPVTSTLEDDDEETIEISTACSFEPSMQTTQYVSPGYVYKTATPLTLQAGDEDETLRDPPSTLELHPKKEQQFETMSTMTNTCGGAPDIVTVPADRISFTADSMATAIQVTNVSPFHLMFALKTNADTHLIAAPTTGILRSGQSMTMRVGVTDKFFEECADPGKSIDKLAIDYTLIPQSLSSTFSGFSSQFFQSQNRRRHAIRVFYH